LKYNSSSVFHGVFHRENDVLRDVHSDFEVIFVTFHRDSHSFSSSFTRILIHFHIFTPIYILLHGKSRNVPMIHEKVGSFPDLWQIRPPKRLGSRLMSVLIGYPQNCQDSIPSSGIVCKIEFRIRKLLHIHAACNCNAILSL
jgi:hypothetical protein